MGNERCTPETFHRSDRPTIYFPKSCATLSINDTAPRPPRPLFLPARISERSPHDHPSLSGRRTLFVAAKERDEKGDDRQKDFPREATSMAACIFDDDFRDVSIFVCVWGVRALTVSRAITSRKLAAKLLAPSAGCTGSIWGTDRRREWRSSV